MTHTDDAPVTEADLHSWLDGELPDDRRAAVERHLADHPDVAGRFESYRNQRTLIDRAFGSLLDRPVPTRLRPPFGPRTTGRRGVGWRDLGWRAWAAAAAMVLVFAAGGAGGWFAHGRFASPPAGNGPFVSNALAAYRVFASEVRHPVEVGADQEEHLITWLGKRLGRSLRAPHLSERGYELVGGRLLSDTEGPAAQLMYQDATGRRITVYLRPTSGSADTAFRFAHDGAVQAFYWRDNGLACAVAGEVDRGQLSDLAERIYTALFW